MKATFVGIVAATVLAAIAAFGGGARLRGCQECLSSGTNPYICYITYGVGCL